MKSLRLFPGYLIPYVFIVTILCLGNQISIAQVTQMSDYVIFSGNGGAGTYGPGSNGYGAIVGTSFPVNGGIIGSYSLVKTMGSTHINSNLFSGGKIVLDTNNFITGRMTAANSFTDTGAIIYADLHAFLDGRVDVNGNMLVQSGTVYGPVYISGMYDGPTPINGLNANPTFPDLPAFPPETAFPPDGDIDITNTETIGPGSWGAVTFTSGQTLILNRPGVYVFNSMSLTGYNNLIYNFQNSRYGNFKIYIYGDVDLGQLNASMINGGNAGRIYWEVHGDGSSNGNYNAFSLGTGSTGSMNFFGTVMAYNAAIQIGNGLGPVNLSGALYSRTRVMVNDGVSLDYAPYSPCSDLVAYAGEDAGLCPVSYESAQLGYDSVPGVAYSWSPTTGLSSSTISYPTFSSTTPGITTFIVTATLGTCVSTDTVIMTVFTPPEINGNLNICAGSTTLLTASDTAASESPWSSSNDLVATVNDSGLVTGISPGTSVIMFTNNYGCVDTVLLTVNGPPVIDLSGYNTTCINSAPFELHGYPAGGIFYGPGITGNMFDPGQAGTGAQPILYYIHSGSCGDTVNAVITVYPVPDANAGPDFTLICTDTIAVLQGSTNTPFPMILWEADDSTVIILNENTLTPTITRAARYVLNVTDDYTGCTSTDTVQVLFTPCIQPYFPPPPGGKNNDLLGPELSQLSLYSHQMDSVDNIFVFDSNYVYIEVIVKLGYEDAARTMLQSLGMMDSIQNEDSTLIVSGRFPIANLQYLNLYPSLFDYVRPMFPPITSGGVAYTLGDVAQHSDIARSAFNLDGSGIRIGVLSDSYNTLPGNPARIDVLNGDLPGESNPDGDTIPVQVLKEYPFGSRTDEGRAMLQIIHDIAPGSTLAFRTGFLTPENFAVGIRELRENGCNVICDDITYITEPFFRDGAVSNAVNDVTALGVSYFSAAGNYGTQSYEAVFSPAPAPQGITGQAHDFGGGDIYQSISLTPGNYTIVLQWDDDFYSLFETATGAQNDFDIYLTYDNGKTFLGYNQENTGKDPYEVLSFKVTANTNAELMIVKASGGSFPRLKYIVFRGKIQQNEYSAGTSTIVGQANSAGAMTVGAAGYFNTPAFGIDPPTTATFSSRGGTAVNNTQRNKPDFVAPNGVNTTVYLGGIDYENDSIPNFYGTSAAAPHAAAVCALLQDAKMKFYTQAFSPDSIRSILQSTAIDMDNPGYDVNSGYGLINAFDALQTIASPTPVILSLEVPPDSTPGTLPISVRVTGKYFNDSTVIYFKDTALTTSFINTNQLSAVIPVFSGNPPLKVYTPPVTPSDLDGGFSNVMYFFTSVKKDVVITADNKTKKYGEKLPEWTSTVKVDGQSLQDAGLTLSDLGLDTIRYNLPSGICSMSSTGVYFIDPDAGPFSPELTEKYNYIFNTRANNHPGLLTINKMPLLITPVDDTVQYGDKINGQQFKYNYTYNDTNILPSERAAFLNELRNIYEPSIVKEVVMVDDRDLYNNTALSAADLFNLAFLSGSKGIVNGSRGIVNGSRGIVNGTTPDTTYVVDVTYKSLANYYVDGSAADLDEDILLINGSRGIANGSRGIVNSESLADGTALINGSRGIANGSRGIANGSRGIVNGEELDGVSNTNTAVIIYEEDLNTQENPDSVFRLLSICAITGLTAGSHYIVPGAFMSSDFEVSYSPGHLIIEPYELQVRANDTSTVYGTPPVYTSVIKGYQYDDIATDVITGNISYTPDLNSRIDAGVYPVVESGLSLIQPSNYYLSYINGTLNVTPSNLIAKADDKTRAYGFHNPLFTISCSGFKYDDNESVISPALTAGTNATFSSPPGTYPISVTAGSTALNYTIQTVNGTLTIEPAPSCNIIAPPSYPVCNSSGNTLTATAPAGYSYAWSISGTGWQITGGNGTLSVSYTAGAIGTTGQFTLTLLVPVTNLAVSTCTISLVSIYPQEFCTYGQGFWGSSGRTCNGGSVASILPGLLSIPLVNGYGTRKVTIGTNESSCLNRKLPAGGTAGQLPAGNVNCGNATGSNYLKNGRFKNTLLGQEIALALSVRLQPALGSLRITGPYITTYAATACVNGLAVPGSKRSYALNQSVVSYLGTNNTVSDLINLANKALGGALPGNAPSAAEIETTLSNLLSAFSGCRIFDGFSQQPKNLLISEENEDKNPGNHLNIYPNPASDIANLSFTAAAGSRAKMEIYDMDGSVISRIMDEIITNEGINTIEVNCSSLSKGLYFVRLIVDDHITVNKLVIIK